MLATGLQNEKKLIPTEDKVALVDMLSGCGFGRIEVASFVSPKWVPQMADGAQVLGSITRDPSISYAALTPNFRGYEGARDAKADEIAIFAAASEGFSMKNINCSIEESLQRFVPIIEAAQTDGIRVRGYISCVAVCPYDGEVSASTVARVAKALCELGCYEISLGGCVRRTDCNWATRLSIHPPARLSVCRPARTQVWILVGQGIRSDRAHPNRLTRCLRRCWRKPPQICWRATVRLTALPGYPS